MKKEFTRKELIHQTVSLIRIRLEDAAKLSQRDYMLLSPRNDALRYASYLYFLRVLSDRQLDLLESIVNRLFDEIVSSFE